ncbi:MAG: hypothetical protein R6X08_12825 [Desulfosalsimonadaceae bacterium]
MTAVSKELTPEQVRKGGSRHASKAMERYIIPSNHDRDLYQDAVRKMRGKAEVVELKKKDKS